MTNIVKTYLSLHFCKLLHHLSAPPYNTLLNVTLPCTTSLDLCFNSPAQHAALRSFLSMVFGSRILQKRSGTVPNVRTVRTLHIHHTRTHIHTMHRTYAYVHRTYTCVHQHRHRTYTSYSPQHVHYTRTYTKCPLNVLTYVQPRHSPPYIHIYRTYTRFIPHFPHQYHRLLLLWRNG